MSKTYAFISALLLTLTPSEAMASRPVHPLGDGAAAALHANTVAPFAGQTLVAPPDTTRQNQSFRPVEYVKKENLTTKEAPLFSGYGIYTDLCGLGMAQFGKWGQYEVGAHVGIKGTYFPVVEIGIGQSNHHDQRSQLHYNVHSPYFRVGMDYNLNKNRASHNRYYVGVRYAFSAFSYDLTGPDITDDYWQQTVPYDSHGVNGAAHWGEILFGLQSQIWKFIHLGWTFRYKARLHEKMGEPGHAYYIPGYGKNGESSSTMGGTFNIIFEL